jgi:hypothetical protein
MDYNPTPTAEFPYTMQTIDTMLHSNGCAWTAILRKHGLRVGTIEQDGRGGADVVHMPSPGARREWQADVAAAFDGNEEDACYWLLLQEEAQSMFGSDLNA